MAEFKLGKGLPTDLKQSIDLNLNFANKNEAEEHYNKMFKLMDKIKRSGTREASDKCYEAAPEHVKRVQGHIDFKFITMMAVEMGLNEEVNEKSYHENWEKGAPMNASPNGTIEHSGYFRKRETPKRSGQRKAKTWREHPIKIPTKPFKFMTKANLKRAWKDFEKRIGKHLREINEDEIKTCPIRSFGVEQGDYVEIEGVKVFNKLRSCWDFREGNAYCDQSEYLHFWATPEILAAIQAAIAGSTEVQTPVRQSKQDVNLDTEKELKNLFNFDFRKNRPRFKGNKFKAYIPIMEKRDGKGYCNQFANRFPDMVTYAMWDTEKEKFRFFEVDCLDFGSIEAVWWPVRIAHLNSRILNRMGVTCVVYIDDTIMLLRPGWNKRQAEMVDKYYELAGFKMSEDKRESMAEDGGRIKALGIEYKRRKDGIEVSIPKTKIEELEKLSEEICEKLRVKKASIKDFEKLHGKATFTTCLSDDADKAEVRVAAHFARESEFFNTLNNEGPGELIKITRQVTKVASEAKPVRICFNNITRQVIGSLTDAASPARPMLGGMLAGKNNLAWHHEWKGKVEFWNDGKSKIKSHIGIWELMSVLIQIDTFASNLAKKKIYFFVENLGDVYNLVKMHSNCPVCAAIVRTIIRKLKKLKTCQYFIYINTERNPADKLTRLTKFEDLRKTFTGLRLVNPVTDTESVLVEFKYQLHKSKWPNPSPTSKKDLFVKSEAKPEKRMTKKKGSKGQGGIKILKKFFQKNRIKNHLCVQKEPN